MTYNRHTFNRATLAERYKQLADYYRAFSDRRRTATADPAGAFAGAFGATARPPHGDGFDCLPVSPFQVALDL